MGYTHYWYTKPELTTPENWKKFAIDCKKIFAFAQNEMGIALADGSGTPQTQPEVTPERIFFNGSDAQPVGVWTTDEKISIPWPSPTASISETQADPIAEKTNGHWFAGNLVEQRVAPIETETGLGSGSYETFGIERVRKAEERGYSGYKEGEPQYGKIFECCKTAYRPYDLVCTAVLIAAKHHFGNDIHVSSDGEDKDWMDGRILCNNVLGYGMNFEI